MQVMQSKNKSVNRYIRCNQLKGRKLRKIFPCGLKPGNLYLEAEDVKNADT